MEALLTSAFQRACGKPGARLVDTKLYAEAVMVTTEHPERPTGAFKYDVGIDRFKKELEPMIQTHNFVIKSPDTVVSCHEKLRLSISDEYITCKEWDLLDYGVAMHEGQPWMILVWAIRSVGADTFPSTNQLHARFIRDVVIVSESRKGRGRPKSSHRSTLKYVFETQRYLMDNMQRFRVSVGMNACFSEEQEPESSRPTP